MKAEKFLNRLGLSVNIVIVILLLVIVYYVCCINDNLSIDLPVEYFNVGGQFGGALRTTDCSQFRGPQRQICIQQRNDRIHGVSEEEQARRQRMENQAAKEAQAAADRQANSNRHQAEQIKESEKARQAEAEGIQAEVEGIKNATRIAQNLRNSRTNGTAYMAQTNTGRKASQNVQNNKAKRQEIGKAQAKQSASMGNSTNGGGQ